MASPDSKKHKGYDIKFKIEAVEFAEQNTNEKAAKKFQVGADVLSEYKRRLKVFYKQP